MKCLQYDNQIHDILGKIFIHEYIVDNCDLLTITNVDVSNNLRMAKIYLSFLGAKIDTDTLIKLISNDRKRIRYLLGQRLEMQYVPEISFYYDDTIRHANKINTILKKL